MKWNEEKIINALTVMVKATKQKTMPTHTEINNFYGDYKLTNAIRRHGGTRYYAHLLGLEIKECESQFGEIYEDTFISDLHNKLGLTGVKTIPRYPYDVLVEDAVKIDVKASKPYSHKKYKWYSCNLEKKQQTCDIFVIYCIDNENTKLYIIPAAVLSGKSQFSIGTQTSMYDKYLNRWDIISDYVAFMKGTV